MLITLPACADELQLQFTAFDLRGAVGLEYRQVGASSQTLCHRFRQQDSYSRALMALFRVLTTHHHDIYVRTLAMKKEVPHPAADNVTVQPQTVGFLTRHLQHRVLYFRIIYYHILSNRVQNYKKKMESARKICICHKKVVPLHAFSCKKHVIYY